MVSRPSERTPRSSKRPSSPSLLPSSQPRSGLWDAGCVFRESRSGVRLASGSFEPIQPVYASRRGDPVGRPRHAVCAVEKSVSSDTSGRVLLGFDQKPNPIAVLTVPKALNQTRVVEADLLEGHGHGFSWITKGAE